MHENQYTNLLQTHISGLNLNRRISLKYSLNKHLSLYPIIPRGQITMHSLKHRPKIKCLQTSKTRFWKFTC